MICIALTNQKGGVGKTTSAVNLSAALAKLDKRVLLVDMDPQGNATTGSGLNKNTITQSVYSALGQPENSSGAVHPTEFGYDILPANRDLAGAEIELADIDNREWQLFAVLQAIADNNAYDFVLIDCPPSLSLLTINALCAADYMLVPMQCEYYALEGLADLMATYKRMRENLGAPLRLLGLVLTMFDARNLLAIQVQETLITHFGNKLFNATIPRNVRLAESPSHGKPSLFYDPRARGSLAYVECCDELVQRITHDMAQSTDLGMSAS